LGQDIAADGFVAEDFQRFSARLAEETAAFAQLAAEGGLSRGGPHIGLELEVWLIDRNHFPAPHNQSFLQRLGDPEVVAELSRFSVEINAPVETLAGHGLKRMHAHLSEKVRCCASNAHADVDTIITIGTLPTLRKEDLSLAAMTPYNRYVALNREAMRQRGNAPLNVDIDSAIPDAPHFTACYEDVMLEAATTSLQLHLQLPPEHFARHYNASLQLSAPLLAIAANSPFLFGQPLWHETRIAAFEQSLQDPRGRSRVIFASDYAGDDLGALFAENLRDYPVLLPYLDETPTSRFPAMRLHNGTIWRWVRPLVGFDEDGTPHLRIEQRVMPAGPSNLDMMANAAFFYGAVHALADRIGDKHAALPIEVARANFYTAARNGLGAELVWHGGSAPRPARAVVEELLPLAAEGLAAQGMAAELIDHYLSVIAMRLATGRTGAAWQLEHHARHGDLFALTAAYVENQRTGLPVHEWPL